MPIRNRIRRIGDASSYRPTAAAPTSISDTWKFACRKCAARGISCATTTPASRWLAAREAADARLFEGERLVLMANNSDRQGNSWGGHLNVLVTRDLWQRIFDRMYPDLFVLAAFQVSSILYTGQGKVGSENGKPWVPFQITQRGDFFECIEGEQTTYRRPIVNSRDEPHCGPAPRASELARLHCIFHDTTMTDTSNYLKAGVTQLVLALMETGWCDRQVMLENPLEALTAWGHDPDLQACAVLADGRRIAAIEHQRLFLDAVKGFVANGDAGCVPEAGRIVAIWEDTLSGSSAATRRCWRGAWTGSSSASCCRAPSRATRASTGIRRRFAQRTCASRVWMRRTGCIRPSRRAAAWTPWRAGRISIVQ